MTSFGPNGRGGVFEGFLGFMLQEGILSGGSWVA